MSSLHTALLIAITLAVPLAGALATGLLHKKPQLRNTVVLTTSSLLLINVINLFYFYLEGGRAFLALAPLIPVAAFSFTIEPLGLIFASMVSFLWLLTSIYSISYLEENQEKHQTRFHVCMTLSIAATIGIAFSANLITLFICYELLTLFTWPLVTHAGTREAYKAGTHYLLLLLGTSMAGLLPAIIAITSLAGHTSFLTEGILPPLQPHIFALILFFTIYGVGKAALMPLHSWLPAAMVAPSPVSALLHAVAVVKAGIFVLLKMGLYSFDFHQWQELSEAHWWAGEWVIYAAGFTTIAASYIALRQEQLKKLLAYSTVSQLGMMVMAIGLATPKGFIAAALHMLTHAFAKITLFFAAGAIYTTSHKTTIPMLSGIGRTMPWTMTAFTLAALSMIGLPPFGGFISKYLILTASWERASLFAIAVVMISTLLNAAYFLPIIYRAFFTKADIVSSGQVEAPLNMRIALCITAGIAVFFGLISYFLVPWLSTIIR